LQDKGALRSREIEATRQNGVARISARRSRSSPRLSGPYCGLLIDRTAVLAAICGDLTANVVHALDAQDHDVSFDRETLSEKPGR